MVKKGKNFYSLYRKKKKTGDEVDPNLEIELDIGAAEITWPNFKIFYETFKDHPSLGPGSVEDSTACILSDAVSESTHDTVQNPANEENLLDLGTSLSTSPPSWDSSNLNDNSVYR